MFGVEPEEVARKGVDTAEGDVNVRFEKLTEPTRMLGRMKGRLVSLSDSVVSRQDASAAIIPSWSRSARLQGHGSQARGADSSRAGSHRRTEGGQNRLSIHQWNIYYCFECCAPPQVGLAEPATGEPTCSPSR